MAHGAVERVVDSLYGGVSLFSFTPLRGRLTQTTPHPSFHHDIAETMAPDAANITSFGPTLEAIKSKLPEKLQNPQIGIICGSGLSGLVDTLREVEIVPYENIPGFGRSTGELNLQFANRTF